MYIQSMVDYISKHETYKRFIADYYRCEDNPKVAQAIDELIAGKQVKFIYCDGAFGSKIQPFMAKINLPNGQELLITKKHELYGLASTYGKSLQTIFKELHKMT